MSSITLPRETVQQALEALEAMNPYPASKEDQRASALAALLAALVQQDEPVEEPAYKVKVTGRWHDAEPLPPAFSLPDGEHLLYTAPRKAEPVLQALQNLASVCQRMDLEHQAERPSEAEYQAAMQAAQAAIQAVEGAA